jgi:hypothetical protein
MAGHVPAIHALRCKRDKTWMPGTSPGMTAERLMETTMNQPASAYFL